MEDIGEHQAVTGLEIDENINLIERVERFCVSGVLVQRIVHVRELSACAEKVGVSETVRRIVPLLKVLVCDPEFAVRQHPVSYTHLTLPTICSV